MAMEDKRFRVFLKRKKKRRFNWSNKLFNLLLNKLSQLCLRGQWWWTRKNKRICSLDGSQRRWRRLSCSSKGVEMGSLHKHFIVNVTSKDRLWQSSEANNSIWSLEDSLLRVGMVMKFGNLIKMYSSFLYLKNKNFKWK